MTDIFDLRAKLMTSERVLDPELLLAQAGTRWTLAAQELADTRARIAALQALLPALEAEEREAAAEHGKRFLVLHRLRRAA